MLKCSWMFILFTPINFCTEQVMMICCLFGIYLICRYSCGNESELPSIHHHRKISTTSSKRHSSRGRGHCNFRRKKSSVRALTWCLSIGCVYSHASRDHLPCSFVFTDGKTQLSMAAHSHKYIIVGGGTAGCVLANRLTADKVGVPFPASEC